MATKPCKDCGKHVSPIAYNCPYCMRKTVLGSLNWGLPGEFTYIILIFMMWKIT